MMNRVQLRLIGVVKTLCLMALTTCGQPPATRPSLVFSRQTVSHEAFESAAVLDIDKDGNLDIFSGSFWYQGPDFIKRNYTGPISRHEEYYDDFSAILIDVNGDSNKDIVTGGWFGGTLLWKENPGKEGIWKEHLIARCGNIESTRSWDFDKDGVPEIVPNTPGKPLTIYRLKKGTTAFDSIPVINTHGHGLGYGDINSDGRGDLIIDAGWLECPANPFTEKWILHSEFAVTQASVPILVTDVNGDGKNDLIVGQGHDYGLNWFEQKVDSKKLRSWIKHPIDLNNSQFHSMEWEDIDNDGHPELITGKRYRAHNDKDPGAHDPVGLYYYVWNGQFFSKQIISYGEPGTGKGTGIYFEVKDLNSDGWKDVVVAGKDGLSVFYNKGIAK